MNSKKVHLVEQVQTHVPLSFCRARVQQLSDNGSSPEGTDEVVEVTTTEMMISASPQGILLSQLCELELILSGK